MAKAYDLSTQQRNCIYPGAVAMARWSEGIQTTQDQLMQALYENQPFIGWSAYVILQDELYVTAEYLWMWDWMTFQSIVDELNAP